MHVAAVEILPHFPRHAPFATFPWLALQVGTYDREGEDIVDEALTYYRANVLFRNYELQVEVVRSEMEIGWGDRTEQ